MKRIAVLGIAVLAGLIVCAGFAWASIEGDCKAVVDKAAGMFKSKGKDAAIKAVNDPKGPFVKGELYVFAVDMNNKVLAHPMNQSLVGKDVSKVKDPKGKLLFAEFLDVAKGKGVGWVEYMWPKPGAKEPSPKRSYIMKIPGEEVYIGAGYYK